LKSILKHKFLYLGLFLFGILFAPKVSQAASIYLSPGSGNFSVGQTITVTVRVNTQGEAANTAEANVTYSADTLELTRVAQGSTFFLPAPGSPSKGNSVAYFGGGQPTPGYTGSSGLLGTLTFRAKAVGTATVAVPSGKVLLNDGFGTDALDGTTGAQFTIAQAAQSIGNVVVTSTTHPDSSQSYTGKTVDLSWSRPTNAYGFSFELDQEADTVPDSVLDTTITTTKTYDNLADGVWYFHIRARSQDASSAFGPTTHFKININVALAPTPTPSPPSTATSVETKTSFLSTLEKTISVPLYLILFFNFIFLFLLALLIWALFRRDKKASRGDLDVRQVQEEIDESLEDLKQEISQKLLGLSAKSSEELYEKETEVAKELRSGIVKTKDKIDKKISRLKKKPVPEIDEG
jgi:hypothetical protein